jgi:glycosyltransferase involved in cell wall biosynthesis
MKVNYPVLTVIVPMYNVASFIKKALHSIQDQSFKDYRCIIIDDCSTDNTIGQVKKFLDDSRFQLIKNEVNLGKPKSIDKALAITNSKYLTIHDGDDWSSESRYEKQINFLESNQEYVMCGTSFFHVSEKGVVLDEATAEIDYDIIKNNIIEKSQFHGPTLLFKSEILREVGGLFRYMKMGEDIDFTMRVVEKFPATNLKEPLYYYRINQQSLTKNYKHDIKSKIIDRLLIQRLALERKQKGKDCLMLNDDEAFQENITEIVSEYESRKDDFLDEYVAFLLHFKLTFTALQTILYRMYCDGVSLRKFKMFVFVLFKKS